MGILDWFRKRRVKKELKSALTAYGKQMFEQDFRKKTPEEEEKEDQAFLHGVIRRFEYRTSIRYALDNGLVQSALEFAKKDSRELTEQELKHLLARAIFHGNLGNADSAAKLLGRELTQLELFRIADHRIRWSDTNPALIGALLFDSGATFESIVAAGPGERTSPYAPLRRSLHKKFQKDNRFLPWWGYSSKRLRRLCEVKVTINISYPDWSVIMKALENFLGRDLSSEQKDVVLYLAEILGRLHLLNRAANVIFGRDLVPSQVKAALNRRLLDLPGIEYYLYDIEEKRVIFSQESREEIFPALENYVQSIQTHGSFYEPTKISILRLLREL